MVRLYTSVTLDLTRTWFVNTSLSTGLYVLRMSIPLNSCWRPSALVFHQELEIAIGRISGQSPTSISKLDRKLRTSKRLHWPSHRKLRRRYRLVSTNFLKYVLLLIHAQLDATPFWYQMKVVVQRNNVALWRQPDYIFSRLFIHVFSAFFASLALLQLKHSLRDLQYRVSFPLLSYFKWVLNRSVNRCSECTMVFHLECLPLH